MKRALFLFVLQTIGPVSFAAAQSFVIFPKDPLISVFPADPSAHRMKIGNIPGKKDMRASLGGVIPLATISNRRWQLSSAASVQFGIHPSGQAEIVSMEYYVDYAVLDYAISNQYFLRALVGHTSHHLSDTEFEKRQLSQSLNYSRDYVAAYAIYTRPSGQLFYAGANFGYVFHLEGKEKKRWQWHFGGETVLFQWSKMEWYTSFDSRWYQEAGFQFANHYQFGTKHRWAHGRTIRAAYQFRHGLDERGQFFPGHYREHLILVMVDLS